MWPILVAGLIGAGASLLGGWMQSNAATNAANTEADAANRAVDLEAATIAQARVDAAPWLQAGKTALEQYMGEMGLSATGAGGSPFASKFTETPGYKFAISEGEKGIKSNLAALGMKNSGPALKALDRFRTGTASSFYDSYLNRLSETAGMGQVQVNNTNQQSLNSSANQGNAMMAAGSARATGYIGAANSWSNALSNFSRNAGKSLSSFNNNWQVA